MSTRVARPRRASSALLSPGAFSDALGAAITRAGTASLLLCDLDGLQPLNQEAGRDTGDRAIAAAIGVVAKHAKTSSAPAARLGGDEFALLMPGLALEPAFLFADRLREELNAALAKAVPRGHSCTVTIGVANAPRDAKTAEQLLRKADLALYSAKEQGGNAVGLTPGEDMVLKSSYYSSAQLARLKNLAERQKKKEAVLLREALDDLLRKYDRA